MSRATGPTKQVVQLVWDRDQGRCGFCGQPIHGVRGFDWSVSHRRPRRAGGDRRIDTNQPANLVLVCGSATTGCHEAIESQRGLAYQAGHLLTATAIPDQVPIRHAVHGWVLLTNEGTHTKTPEGTNSDP